MSIDDEMQKYYAVMEMSNRGELLPCPFCGGKKSRVEKTLRDGYQGEETDPDAYAYYVFCPFCGCQGGWKKSAGGAAIMWNIRREPVA